jgi:hypothetical protein
MSKSSSHLRLVSSNDSACDRTAMARAFREVMTEHIRAHTDGTNVNKKTLLATDYLNHFNEVITLLELLPTAPAELAAELANWRHETYEEHFHHSGFRDKALAIAGYRHAPIEFRQAFDRVSEDMSSDLTALLRKVQSGVESQDINAVTMLCMEAVPALQAKLEILSSIVNGEVDPSVHAQVEAAAYAGAHQAAVDKLFD